MNLLRIAIFALASAGLVYVSPASLRRPRAHGFWRFWAWEAIVALVVLLTYIKVVEEREMVARFGEAYLAYRRGVPFIIPKLRRNR